MTVWRNGFIDDGKLADGTIYDKFTEAETAINNLDSASSKRGAFNHDHAASIVAGLYGASSFFLTADTSTHKYDKAVFGSAITYPGADSNFVNETGLATTPAWVVIGHASATGPYSSGLAKIEFSSGDGVPISQDGEVQGVLVLFNAEIVDASAVVAPTGDDLEAAFCLQVKKGTSWKTLQHTERAVRIQNHRIDNSSSSEMILMDVPIATLISFDVYADEGVVVGTGVRGVRACISLNGGDAASFITLGRWNLTVIPLRCGVS